MIRAYELMIIIDRDTDESGVNAVLDLVDANVKAGGGEVKSVDHWGRRPFAYEINHKSEGYYVVLEIVTEAANLDDLERQLRIADDVVRHKLIRLPDKEAQRRGLLAAAAS